MAETDTNKYVTHVRAALGENLFKPSNLLPDVRRLRALGWGKRRIGPELGISIDQAQRLLKKLELDDARKPSQSTIVAEIEPRTASEYAERIAICWRRSVEAIIETGRLLVQAKEILPHGEFRTMIDRELPFGPRTAQRLMVIAGDQRLSNATHVSLLPPSWGTLYELTRLDDRAFEAQIDDGTICADMDRRDVASIVKRERRAIREANLGAMQAADNLKLPSRRYGVIVADPEWRFEPWSRQTGMDRAADNHYPTSCTEVLAARDVPSIAADDCVLFLWATGPMMPHALLVMSAWGFDYKAQYVWGKEKAGTGYWNREKHELLLVGTRGSVPCPAPGTQWDSLIIAPRGEHSEKPACFLEMVERYFPTLPRIELNARRAREGWDWWGAEATREGGLNPQRADAQ